MFQRFSFLKTPDEKYRQILQLEGFVSNTYLEIASDWVNLTSFKLPKISVNQSDTSYQLISEYLRLGNRLERYFAFVVEQSRQYRVVLQNFQIVEHKKTIGELDFILQDTQTDELLHVELGGKLYLYDPIFEREIDRWVGPNRKDSLVQKVEKLKNEQFPLLFHPKTVQLLAEKGIDVTKIQQKICLKVRLFLPKDRYGFELPPFVEPHNIKGYYITWKEFQDSYYAGYQYFIPEKQDWIVHPKYGEVWFNYQEIKGLIAEMYQSSQNPLIWLKKEHEYETFFVVNW